MLVSSLLKTGQLGISGRAPSSLLCAVRTARSVLSPSGLDESRVCLVLGGSEVMAGIQEFCVLSLEAFSLEIHFH